MSLNPCLIETKTKAYEGAEISHFEDRYGKLLESILMEESVVIVFKDGRKMVLAQDWRGTESYISQYDR